MLAIELVRIPPARRLPDAEINAAYAAARPVVLSALLDLTARVLAVLPVVKPDVLPRMADFARVLAAVDRIQGWNTLRSYTDAAADATTAVLESDPVAAAVVALLDHDETWEGTTSELLELITPERRPRGWPQSARGLAGALTRLAPALRAYGISYERQTRGATRRIVLRQDRFAS